jgi:hypothetical protein
VSGRHCRSRGRCRFRVYRIGVTTPPTNACGEVCLDRALSARSVHCP